MRQLNFHKNFFASKPPTKSSLPILEKAKAIYKNWIVIHRNIPRTERFGIGTKIDFLFLELLELLRRAVYSSVSEKIKILENTTGKIDSLRFFVQLLWETRLISNMPSAPLTLEYSRDCIVSGVLKTP